MTQSMRKNIIYKFINTKTAKNNQNNKYSCTRLFHKITPIRIQMNSHGRGYCLSRRIVPTTRRSRSELAQTVSSASERSRFRLNRYTLP